MVRGAIRITDLTVEVDLNFDGRADGNPYRRVFVSPKENWIEMVKIIFTDAVEEK